MTRTDGIAVLLAVCAAFATLPSRAEGQKIYKCTDANGGTIFSPQPCGSNAKEMDSDGHVASPHKDEEKKSWALEGPAASDSGAQCMKVWKPRLKHPETATLSNPGFPGIVVKSGTRRVLIAQGRSTDDAGRMLLTSFVCDIDKKGDVIGNGDPYGDIDHAHEMIDKESDMGIEAAFPGVKLN